MEVMFAEHKLHNACQVLFGSEIQVSSAFLEYLQASGVKTAYRKKAFETHPDQIGSLPGSGTGQSADLFMAVQQAYERLSRYIDARENGYSPGKIRRAVHPASKPFKYKPRRAANETRQKWRSGANRTQQRYGSSTYGAAPKNNRPQTDKCSAKMYRGPIPSRKLLFGHYLYYSGVTSWQTIIKALIWQRTRRPKIGEIGCRFGWLDSGDILAILQSRSFAESFGKSAVKLGFLTEQQLRLLLFQQNKLQKKFGDFFVANNLLTSHQLNQLVRQFRIHNLTVLPKQKYSG